MYRQKNTLKYVKYYLKTKNNYLKTQSKRKSTLKYIKYYLKTKNNYLKTQSKHP